MHVFRGLPTPDSRSPCVLTIGNFDGVHRGHRALLARLTQRAHELALPAAVMTFEPHPREYFAQIAGDITRAPTRIANLRDKLEALSACRIDRVVVEHFNARFSSISAENFLRDVVAAGCNARYIIVGDDFRFGAKRAGDFATMRELGSKFGFEVDSMPTVADEAGRVSSSAVRVALARGDFARADQLLGHPWGISGHVVYGRQLGRTLGYPTINVRVAHKRPPVTGIFVVRVHGLAPNPLDGVASLGVRPTVEDAGRMLLETFVFGWSGNAYGKLVRVEPLHKIRDEAKYDSLTALTEAIARDERTARAWLQNRTTLAPSSRPPIG